MNPSTDRGAELMHLWISLPRTPTLATTTSVNLLSTKCYPCARSKVLPIRSVAHGRVSPEGKETGLVSPEGKETGRVSPEGKETGRVSPPKGRASLVVGD